MTTPQQAASPFPLMLAQVRRFFRTHRAAGMAEIMPLIKQAKAFVDSEPEGSATRSRYSSELAWAVSRIMVQSQDMKLMRNGMELLFNLGPYGHSLAASVLFRGGLSFERQQSLTGSFEPHERLALWNRFFLTARDVDPPLLQWAFDGVREVQSEDPEEALVFLHELPETHDEASHPVQNEFMSGRFGVWLHQLLKLDLDQEQTVYMARTVDHLRSPSLSMYLSRHLKNAHKADDTDSLRIILETLGRHGEQGAPRLVKAVSAFLRHPDDAIRLATARALMRLDPEQGCKALGNLYGAVPGLRREITVEALGLSRDECRTFIGQVPQEQRPALLAGMLSILARLESERLLGLAGLAKGKDGAAQALRAWLQEHEKWAFQPVFTPDPRPAQARFAQAGPGQGTEKPALLAKAFKLVGAEEEPEREDPGRAAWLLELAPGASAADKEARAGIVHGLKLAKVRFTDVSFAQVDLSAGAFKSVAFTDCTFKNVDFTAGRFSAVSFDGCVFEDCCFADLTVNTVRMRGCKVSACFAGAHLRAFSAEECLFRQCTFWGARLEQAQVIACHFADTDFTLAAWVAGDMDGVSFADCRFEATYARDTRMRNADAEACTFHACRFLGLDTDEASFLAAEQAARDAALRRIAKGKGVAPPKSLAGADGVRALYGLLEVWQLERDCLRRGRAFLAHNTRRKRWAGRKLAAKRRDFFRMLPGLLEAARVHDGKEWIEAVPLDIAGYRQGYAGRGLLRQAMGEHYELAFAQSGPTPVPVHAVYCIGSIGSIAQSRASDLDIWICYGKDEVAEQDLALVRAKLARIEKWAEDAYGLEVHFFPMDLDATRRNDFGISDQESAGTTQAKLLKEEFYRTALRLAGRAPTWWYVHEAVAEKDYPAELARLARLPGHDANPLLDLGYLGDIPREEFFGASLWQIVKALKSPFKSVMKFALLDKYYSGRETPVMLCNRIKGNLFAGAWSLWTTDPYAVLFREVYEYYKRTDNADARELMRMAFIQKTGCTRSVRTSGRPYEVRGSSWMEFFFPHSDAAIAAEFMPDPASAQEEGAVLRFSDLVSLGDVVGKFMFRSYEQVASRLERDESAQGGVLVSSDDLTKVGRKMFSYLKPRKNKIMRISFVDSPKGMFSALDFTCEGLQGASMTWVVRGEAPQQGKRPSQLEELRRDVVPVRLLFWLIANGIYMPGLHVGGSNIQAPVSVPDVTELMKALHEFFPPHEVLHTDVAEALNDERAERVFVLVNFLAPREEHRYLDAALIYATNWGELFCIAKPREVGLLAEDPWGFLAANMQVGVARDARVRVFQPRRCVCPRLEFPART